MIIEKSKDAGAFADFELAGWDHNIAGYDDAFGRVSRQTVDATLDAAGIRSGMKLLDVCTGPGMLVEAALRQGVEAVGLDFSEAVLKHARKRVPNGEFRRGDAQDLPFADSSFDAVVCGYGVMHLPEPEAALHEMHRVLRPGGRLAVSVWDKSTPDNGFGIIYAAVGAHGSFDVPLPHGPDFFQFGTKEQMTAALKEVGFADVAACLVEQQWQVDSAAEMLSAMQRGTVRARALLAAQSPTAIKAMLQFLEERLSCRANAEGGYDIPLPAIVGSGVKL